MSAPMELSTRPGRSFADTASGLLRGRGLFLIWVLIILFFWAWAGPTFFSLANAQLVASAASTTAIFGAALGLCAIAGALDLSVPGVAALSAVLASQLIVVGVPVWLALIVCVLIGVAAGALNGFLIGFGLNPMATTIGTLTVFGGIASVITNDVPVQLGVPSPLAWLGTSQYFGLPMSVYIAIAIYVLGWLFLTKTRAGVRMTAVGGSPEGARRIGLRIQGYKLLGFVLSGACSAIAGIVVASIINQANPSPDVQTLFEALTAVALSGMSLAGGRGSLLRVLLGALIIATVSDALIIKGIAPSWSIIATGVLLIAALGSDLLGSRGFSARRILASFRRGPGDPQSDEKGA
ncbi:MAG TPA: ABC transporter permease [Galbitalea sp.]|nr:ABC transporter permease [Galbitalea sp.]